MNWHGVWARLPASSVRHAAVYNATAARWDSVCPRAESLVCLRPDVISDFRPCAVCVARIRNIAAWWADQLHLAVEALRAEEVAS